MKKAKGIGKVWFGCSLLSFLICYQMIITKKIIFETKLTQLVCFSCWYFLWWKHQQAKSPIW